MKPLLIVVPFTDHKNLWIQVQEELKSFPSYVEVEEDEVMANKNGGG